MHVGNSGAVLNIESILILCNYLKHFPFGKMGGPRLLIYCERESSNHKLSPLAIFIAPCNGPSKLASQPFL